MLEKKERRSLRASISKSRNHPRRAESWSFTRNVILISSVLALLMLVAGSPGAAITLSAIAGMFWVLWWWADRIRAMNRQDRISIKPGRRRVAKASGRRPAATDSADTCC